MPICIWGSAKAPNSLPPHPEERSEGSRLEGRGGPKGSTNSRSFPNGWSFFARTTGLASPLPSPKSDISDFGPILYSAREDVRPPKPWRRRTGGPMPVISKNYELACLKGGKPSQPLAAR